VRKLFILGAVLLLFVSGAGAQQQYPVMEMVANRVIQRYQQSSCGQLWQQRERPHGPEEQNAIQALRGDPQMRRAFIGRVAAPIANKLFECGMIP